MRIASTESKELYSWEKPKLEVLSPINVRRELFKLFYLQKEGLFDLNQKADAAEALMNILSILHCSQSRDLGCQPKKSKDPFPKSRLEINYDADCKIRDQNGQILPCAVHTHF